MALKDSGSKVNKIHLIYITKLCFYFGKTAVEIKINESCLNIFDIVIASVSITIKVKTV